MQLDHQSFLFTQVKFFQREWVAVVLAKKVNIEPFQVELVINITAWFFCNKKQ